MTVEPILSPPASPKLRSVRSRIVAPGVMGGTGTGTGCFITMSVPAAIGALLMLFCARERTPVVSKAEQPTST